MSRVLGVSGSPRKGGNSDIILKYIMKGVKEEGIPFETVRLRDYQFQPCIGCERCRKTGACMGLQDGMQLIYPKLLESPGLVLVSPTHNYNVTAWMKAFIDRLYCYYIFAKVRPGPWSSRLKDQGRKAVVGTIGEEPNREGLGFTLEAMSMPLRALGYEVLSELYVLRAFDKGAVKQQTDSLADAEEMGRRLARQIREV